jgi:hypothetical protein
MLIGLPQSLLKGFCRQLPERYPNAYEALGLSQSHQIDCRPMSQARRVDLE